MLIGSTRREERFAARDEATMNALWVKEAENRLDEVEKERFVAQEDATVDVLWVNEVEKVGLAPRE